MSDPFNSTLAQANRLLRQKQYDAALASYAQVLQERPELAHIVRFNMNVAERYRQQQSGQISFNVYQAAQVEIGRDSTLAKDCALLDQCEFKHQLEPIVGKAFSWKALGEDPYFVLKPESIFTSVPGWYRCSLMMRAKKKVSVAKLYLDKGNGFNEADTVSLPFRKEEMMCRVFWLDSAPKSLRFDPLEYKGEFEVQVFRIEPISALTACQSIIERLIDEGEEFAGIDWKSALEKIFDQSGNHIVISNRVLELYEKTFKQTHYGDVSYEEWIETVEKPSLPTPEEVARQLESLPYKPIISIVLPVYNTPEKYLCACIDSVLGQSYPHWQLCIADDNSTQPHVRHVLETYASKDSRIRVTYRDENGHISRASNSALDLARGDYVALLDHDDVLAEHALYHVAIAINEHKGAHVFYSDEDIIDARGHRLSGHFKSDWNPDLFYSQNYITHLAVYRRELLVLIGGFRPGVEGSQDHDLLLRCLPHIRHDQIIHIPKVLYHWRAIEGSTALNPGEKNYTWAAGIESLQNYFAKHYQSLRVEAGLLPNTYRVIWPIPEPAPLVSLLIPTRDKKEVTEVAVRSILEKTTYPHYEILILDNGSVEIETLAWFDAIQKQDARVRVIRYDYPFNFSAINNFGVRQAKGDIIGLVNNDVEVISPNWLTEMVRHVCRREIGCVGAKLYYRTDTIQHAGVILGLGVDGIAGHSHKGFPKNHPGYLGRLCLVQNISAVTGACMLVRREIYEQVGGLDEMHLTVAFNDVDFCLKVRQAGYRNLWTPYAELYHHESISRGYEDTPEKQARFQQEVAYMKSKWGEALMNDPYYNPNLTKDREDFSLALAVDVDA